MTRADELLTELRKLNVRLWADGDQLRISAPQGVLTPEHQSRLAALKGEILAQLREDAQRHSGPEIPLRRIDRGSAMPLSYGQERIWFLDQMGVGAVYNVPWGTRLQGSLDGSVLERGFNEIIRRHEGLRSRFRVVDGRPAVEFLPSVHVPLRTIDLGGWGQDEQGKEVRRLTTAETQTPFDLSKGPLIRALCIRLAATDHVLAVTMHHTVCDYWSVGVLARELAQIYEAYSHGKPSPLPELPFQYVDFAAWQRQCVDGGSLREQLAYWRTRLADPPSEPSLPTDRPRPALQTYRGHNQSVTLTESVSSALRALGRQSGATLFMTLLAAFKVLLYRYSGQTDLIVGTPIAGRGRKDTEGHIGIFLNTLALRTDLSGNPTFAELLSRVSRTALGAYANQDIPIEKILEELRPQRDPSRTPLFQVLFNLFNLGGERVGVSGLAAQQINIHEDSSKFDLTLYAAETERNIFLNLVYNVDLFEESTIARMIRHMEVLLGAVAADPSLRLSRIPILTEAERNAPRTPRERIAPPSHFVEFSRAEIEQSMASRFEAQVQRGPDRPAVKTRRYSWTYAELNRRANLVAQGLQVVGPSGPARLALLVEHDAPLLAALFGILKSGHAYVPLDPTYPPQRLRYMLEDSAASALVTSNEHLALARQLSPDAVTIINIDSIPAEGRSENLGVSVAPDALAYILYTSGSTGNPKGVMQNHRNALHHVRCATNGLRIGEQDRVTLLSSISFDAAVVDIYAALLNGAALFPFDIRSEGLTGLADWIDERQVTVYHSTPTVFRHFTDGLAGDRKMESVRAVVLGGEAVRSSDLKLYRGHFSRRSRFVNLMGASESTIATLFLAGPDETGDRETVPIGFPVEDTELILLDSSGEPTEFFGEIAIRSRHLALGYWNQPELTAAAFRAGDEEGSRIYRTGDLGRLREDGTLVFAGRRDQQVKVRGIRVELGEIERTLSDHDDVSETAIRYDAASQRVIAYVVPRNGIRDASLLREHVRKTLPEYMVPSRFVFLDAMPQTPSGKVNRRALPMPDDADSPSASFVAPRTAAEKLLAEIWCKVLNREQVGIYDNFFDLGGHSLLMIQVVSEFRERTGVQVNPVEFLRQSLGQLAAAVESKIPGPATAVTDRVDLPAVEPLYFGPPERPLFGCFHVAPVPKNLGVVICQPTGHEYVRCHRAFRQFAGRLAMSGVHCLRFDYFGSGDSSGDDDAARLEDWKRDISAAMDALKSRFGVFDVSLVGLRLGASLALVAAAGRHDVDALALWDPVASGATYVDELESMAYSTAGGNGHPYPSHPKDVLGSMLTSAMADDLRGLDLRTVSWVSARRILLLETGETAGEERLAAQLQERSPSFERYSSPDARIWLREPFEAIVPQQTLEHLIEWMSKGGS